MFRTILTFSLLCAALPAKLVNAQDLPEFYAPVYGNWCGPNHPLNISLAGPPTDMLDAVCMRHDQCIALRGEYDCGCDLAFLQDMQKRHWPDREMRDDARALFDAIAVMPCRNPEGSALKQTIFASELAVDLMSGRGNPVDVLTRWRRLFLGIE